MRIRIVDAFTDRPYAGNPAAVLVLPPGPWPSDDWMQRLAAEANLSETAFVRPLPQDERPGTWGLRWFTPSLEVDLCGHATLATAHLLHSTGALGEPVGGVCEVGFRSRSGLLTASIAADGSITLDFPANPPRPVDVPDGIAAALGAPVLAAYDTGALGDLLVELADEKTVRTLAPDHRALQAVPGLRGVIVTAAPEAPGGGYDFVSRWFGAGAGIGEDPVTGSAHTALAPLWAARLGRDELVGRQLSARGGSVAARLSGERVLLTGRAVTVLDGELAPAARP
ncbi:PhzF family phenazine biosynthesis protein [Streptacidiphilus sp. PB12-B1b]|uniref:PhzF family phenazine biosynthesis protein n=1 Tax=Streptacidiphilus sp. PB12-B1b TaxID=2705012 RepID=UPI0015FDBFC9|nr:PhzF family phenazine biosynthesis protein [Streptacidiphilus sp. PB12-B1b]QMU76288.1 PhzF family phenazine biosynthesis protein [Streptacidiphilus sp. PB12-B1b]